MPTATTRDVIVTTIASALRTSDSDTTDVTDLTTDATVSSTTTETAIWPYYPGYPYYNPPNTWDPYPTQTTYNDGWDWFYWDYFFYVCLIVIFLLLVPLIAIKATMRRREEAARAAALQRQRARRQAEVNAANGGANNTVPVPANANTFDPNDITILPKNIDLPPTYDEVVLDCTKQPMPSPQTPTVCNPIRAAVSTMTIETDLESSNNNLAAAAANVHVIEMENTSNNVAEHRV